MPAMGKTHNNCADKQLQSNWIILSHGYLSQCITTSPPLGAFFMKKAMGIMQTHATPKNEMMSR